MRPLHMSGLLVLCLGATSCESVAPDHALGLALGKVTRRMVGSLTSLGGAVDRAAVDLRTLVTDAGALPGEAADEVGRLRDAGVLLVDDRSHSLARVLPHTEEAVTGMVRSGLDRLVSLTHAPSRVGPEIGRSVGDFRRSLENLPRVLHVDRTLLADDSVPERSVEIVPAARQRSWLERLVERISF